MSLGRQLVRNSSTTLLKVVSSTIIALLLPPVLLSHISMEEYGIWAMISILNAYVAMLDLGFHSSLIVLIADSDTKRDHERILDLVNSAFWVYAGLILTISIFSYPVARILAGWLFSEYTQYASLLHAYLVISLVGLLAIPLSGLLRGFQRYDKANYCEIIALITNAIVTILLVIHGWGIWSLVAGSAAGVLIKIFGFWGLAKREFGKFELRWKSGVIMRITHDLFRLSPSDQSIRLHSVITTTIIRVSLNAYAGLEAVAAYDIGKRILNQVGGMSTVIFAPLTASTSALAAGDKLDRVRELSDRSMFYLALLLLPLTSFVIFFSKPLLQAWLSNVDVFQISLVVKLLMLSTMLELFTGPLTTIALGLNNVMLNVIKIAVSAFLSIALIPLLGLYFSFGGILVGEFSAVTLSSILAMAVFYRSYGMPDLVRLWWVLKRTLMASILASIVAILIYIMGFGFAHWPKFYVLAGISAIFVTTTGIVYWRSGLFSSAEVTQLRGLIHRRKTLIKEMD